MSARLLKMVLKEQEEKQRQQQQHPYSSSIEEGEEQEGKTFSNGDDTSESPRGPPINPFDLLNDADSDPYIDLHQENDPDFTNQTSEDKHEKSVLKNTVNVVTPSNPQSKKKKKKRGKEGTSSTTDKMVEKSLDVILESLSLDNPSTSNNQYATARDKNSANEKDSSKQCSTSILQVDPKYLNAENELRRIFGSKVLKSFEKNHQAGSSRQLHGGRRGNYHARRTILVTPSDHWHRWDGSFSMESLETRDGQHYFRYVHSSSSYVEAQRAFEAAKSIHDLNSIAAIMMHHHPYHLDSLLTMAEYFKFVGEHDMSADAVAKSLYAMECAWHSMFTPLQGNCQLKYSHETNKPLFVALFTHMKNLNRRGCHRSALEVCKLLLSLDSDDPMGAMFLIDYLSLRAEEYAWLERFSEEYKSDNSLWLFPNFSYSLAVCRYYLERERTSENSSMDSERATSTDLMKQALMLHPSVLKKLVAKVPLKEQEWVHILKHTFFRSDQTGIPTLDHLVNIYVERNSIIWRIPELQKLLKNSAELVIETLEVNRNEAKDWACVRKEAFPSAKNEYGHLLVSDFSDFIPSVPPEALQDFMVDPRMRQVQNLDQVANLPENYHAPRNIANRNAMAVLFESMLPWVNYGDGGPNDGDQHNVHGRNEDH